MCLSWLGLDPESSKEVALRYWKVLAYTGDYFAMEALEYAYTQLKTADQAALWHTVREIFADADRNFTITVPEHHLETAEREAVNIAQVILAVRRTCTDDGKERLPVLMLQYAIDSKDELDVKLEKLSPSNAFHSLLMTPKKPKSRPLGFAF